LAGACANLGHVLVNAGQARDAEQPLRRALASYDRLQAELGDATPQARSVALEPHPLSAAGEEARREPPALRRQRARKDWSRFRTEAAVIHDYLGLMFAATGRPREAEQATRRAQERFEKLVADTPEEPRAKLGLAFLHERRAGALRERGRQEQAEQEYRRAQALLKQLVADRPTDPLCRRNLAENWDTLGTLLEEMGRLPEAEGAYREAVRLLEKLAADFPARKGYRDLLDASRDRLDRLLRGAPGQR
jgi:tetratricopeptide (TPR) repeat protein